MDIPTIPGAVYTISSTTSCDVTDKASGQPLGTATLGNPFTTPAYSDALTLSDPSALYVQIKTFNHALAALGLLGGGVSELPKGYIRAEFLESSGTQYIITDFVPNNESGILLKSYLTTRKDTIPCGSRNAATTNTRFYAIRSPRQFEGSTRFLNGYGWGLWLTFAQIDVNYVETTWLNWNNDRLAKCKAGQKSLSLLPFEPEYPLCIFAANIAGEANLFFEGRIWAVEFSQDSRVVRTFLPALTPTGMPCMWEKKSKQPFTNDGTGEFIVGFTLTQARQLSKLPGGGVALTISLPSNWQDDAAVVDALATAEGKGWVLTIQTYEAEAGAVSTFALRRIWVRKRAEQNGSYVAADGTRWQVEWCATMVGGDPQEHGYELFRSVEAAAAYWELQPYVYPEEEQLLTD